MLSFSEKKRQVSDTFYSVDKISNALFCYSVSVPCLISLWHNVIHV
jgi:hypothetical protein